MYLGAFIPSRTSNSHVKSYFVLIFGLSDALHIRVFSRNFIFGYIFGLQIAVLLFTARYKLFSITLQIRRFPAGHLRFV